MTSYIRSLKKYCCCSRPQETVVPLEDPVVTEVTATLQDWALLWKQLYVVRARGCVRACTCAHTYKQINPIYIYICLYIDIYVNIIII